MDAGGVIMMMIAAIVHIGDDHYSDATAGLNN